MVRNIMKDHQQFTFAPASEFKWSPSNDTIYFPEDASSSKTGLWSLLHELGHAILGHKDFSSDIELIKIERAAWDKALEIADNYGLEINQEHIEGCMDTYRRWAAKRSRCPVCAHSGLQADIQEYDCINCGSTWQVSASQACEVIRKTTEKPA